jgi:hypothetical protein
MPVRIAYRLFLSDDLKNKMLELVEHYPTGIKNFSVDKLLYILSLIHEIPARNKRGGLSDNGYTNLYTPLLQKFVSNYRQYLDYLLQHHVILCDNHYIPGHKSKGYKMAPAYIGPVKPTMIQNPELIRKMNKYNWELLALTNKYKYLKKWMDGLEIDVSAALAHIEALYNHRIQHPEAREWDAKRKRYKDPLEQYNSAKVNMYYLKDKRFTFFVDETVGRLHTNLTNMPSDLRNFITWKGQKLASIDIANSQPYLSTLLFRSSFYDADKNGVKKLTVFSFPTISSSPFLPISPSPSHIPPPLMLLKSSQQHDTEDIKLYTELVEKGQLYEYMEAAFQSELGMKFMSRKIIKAAMFQVLFTDNRFIGQQEAAPKRLFKQLFPIVYELFATFKKEDATLLPRLLQQIEAKLMLDIIAKRIAREKPNIPIFTIHDSITTTVDNLAYVQRIMKEELTTYLGISPTMKTEHWGQVNIQTHAYIKHS